MKHTEYIQHAQFACLHGKYLSPANDKAEELLASVAHGEVLQLQDKTGRDIKFHRAYFGLLSTIYDNLTKPFKAKVSKSKFYDFLKELRGDYEVTKVGKLEIKHYKSISFGRMSQATFKQYVKDQLPFIYENVIHALYEQEMADIVIGVIEEEWEKYLAKL